MSKTSSRKRAFVQMVVRCDAKLLQAVRGALIEKLHERLKSTWVEVDCRGGTTPTSRTSVSGFADPEFVVKFGPGLSRFRDATLVNQALVQLLRQVAQAPEGKTGLQIFDDWGPKRDSR